VGGGAAAPDSGATLDADQTDTTSANSSLDAQSIAADESANAYSAGAAMLSTASW
jgi:hypothetical protein